MKYYKKNGKCFTDKYFKVKEGTPEITAEEYTAWINATMEMGACKKSLAETDYKAIKYSEGCYTEEEYAPIKAQRQAYRDRINELEALLKE